MISHLTFTLLLTILLSGAAAIHGDRTVRDRACAAAYTFLSCTFFVFAGSWLMYWIHA
ncbi:MAG TPA: hypothetical protein VHW09_01485 [Bryobacteraceae bacterium]|jgi:hypothetical protein|nr:hypothetical protein [Bryobacteraceae bacterium]